MSAFVFGGKMGWQKGRFWVYWLAGLGLGIWVFMLQAASPAPILYQFQKSMQQYSCSPPLQGGARGGRRVLHDFREMVLNHLPALQVHVLPPTLGKWEDPAKSGDYFDQIQPPEFGHLVWSQFPIKVYVERSPNGNRDEEWVKAMLGVVEEWGVYLPLQVVDLAEEADIKILHQFPPLKPGQLRARSGETRYELFVSQQGQEAILSHRFTIWLNPSQGGKYGPAVARHELGHALGIWGHSPVETDVMYFSQVRNPPSISARDVNTLKRVYEGKTRLGWPMEEGGNREN